MSVDPFEDELEAGFKEYEAEADEYFQNEFGDGGLYAEYYEQAIHEFTAGRLSSYYVENPQLVQPASDALEYARCLLDLHPRAALVFATTAIDLCIKAALLQPLVFGLVHTDGVAHFVSTLAMSHNGMERFEGLLTEILKRYGDVDLRSFKRVGAERALWQEVDQIKRIRNGVIHQGKIPEPSEADCAIKVAAVLVEQIFPQVLNKLGLHLHDGRTICAKVHGVQHDVTLRYIPGYFINATVELDEFELGNPPETITGTLVTTLSAADTAAMREAGCHMYLSSFPIMYQIEFEIDSAGFNGRLVDLAKGTSSRDPLGTPSH